MMSNTSLKKILVVDDEEEVLIPLSNILKRANYEVISTTKGKEAVDLAIKLLPDLIILDIVMPDMGGSDVSATLSQNSSTADIPIIFLTGIITKEEECLEKISNHYVLAKPTTGRELLGLVEKILSS